MPDIMVDTYKTVKSKSEGQFKDKGSRFISFVFPVKSEDEIKPIVSEIRKAHHSARHCCYAWRIGTEKIRYRTNDDGEPSSTAGKPILGQILSLNLTNTLIVVVRYFGGTLLGVPGLINAYKFAASDALANAEIVEKFMEYELKVIFAYPEMNNVMHIIKTEKLNQIKTDLNDTCLIQLSVRKSESDRIVDLFKSLNGVTVEPVG
jgi:uncharacterized YigZ family protein